MCIVQRASSVFLWVFFFRNGIRNGLLFILLDAIWMELIFFGMIVLHEHNTIQWNHIPVMANFILTNFTEFSIYRTFANYVIKFKSLKPFTKIPLKNVRKKCGRNNNDNKQFNLFIFLHLMRLALSLRTANRATKSVLVIYYIAHAWWNILRMFRPFCLYMLYYE